MTINNQSALQPPELLPCPWCEAVPVKTDLAPSQRYRLTHKPTCYLYGRMTDMRGNSQYVFIGLNQMGRWNTRARVSDGVVATVDQRVYDELENLANASYTELRSAVETNREYTPAPHERFHNEHSDTKHFKNYATDEEWAAAERVSGWFQQRIRAVLGKVAVREDEPVMTTTQLRQAELIAESRGVDLETAQELVYLRDRVAAIPQSFEEAPIAAPQDEQKACPHCNRIECECSDFDVSPDMGAKG